MEPSSDQKELQKLLRFKLFPGESIDSAITRAIDLYVLTTRVSDILRHVTMMIYCRDFNGSLTDNQRKLVEQLIRLTTEGKDWLRVRRQFKMIRAERKFKRSLDAHQRMWFSEIELYHLVARPPAALTFYSNVS